MPEHHTRKTLLLKIKDADDNQAWDEFVEIYAPMVFAFCRKRGVSEDDASDITQDVLRAIAKAIGSFEYEPSKGKFRSWFFTVARSKLYDFFRKQVRRHDAGGGGTTVMELINEHPDPKEEQDWEIDYRRQIFDWAVTKVRSNFEESSWRAFWMTAVDGEKPADVAAALDISRGAVYAAKARVLGALRDCVQSVVGEEDLDAF